MLASHPAVSDAAVLGVPDERLGQRVAAVIELAATGDADTDDVASQLQDYCREQLARYKVPELVRFVDALPRNAMNKVVKPQLLPLFE